MLSGDGSCTADSIWRFSWRMLMTALVYEAMREGCSCAKRCFSPSISLHRRQIQSPTSSHSQLMYDRGTMQWLWLNSAHISHFRGSDKSNCLHIEQNMMDIVDIRWCLFSVCYCARPLCRFVFCSAYVKCHASCSSVLMEIHSSSSSSYFCMFIYVILVVVGFSCRRWPIRVDICIYCYSLGVMSRAMTFHCLLSGVIFHIEQFKSFNSIYTHGTCIRCNWMIERYRRWCFSIVAYTICALWRGIAWLTLFDRVRTTTEFTYWWIRTCSFYVSIPPTWFALQSVDIFDETSLGVSLVRI